MKKCKYCGKETSRNKRTGEFKDYCCESHRTYFWRNEKRKQRKFQHKCIDCGVDIKPILVYYARCPKHLLKNKQVTL